MDIFEEIIAKLEQIPGSEGTIAELVAEKARFSDPSSDEARIAALMILKKAADASSSSDSAPATTGGSASDEEIVISDEERAKLEAAVATAESVLKRREYNYTCKKKREDVYLIEFNVFYEFCRLSVEVYIEADPLVCFVRATLPITVDETYMYIVSEHIAKLNRKSTRYGTYGINERDGAIECRYRMRYDGGLDETVFEKSLFLTLGDADDQYPELRKLAVGKLKKTQIDDVLKKVNALINDLEV